MTKEVEKVLDLLADKFGTTVEMFWGVLVKQMYIEAIIGFVFVGIGLLLVALWLLWILNVRKRYKKFLNEGNNGNSGRDFGYFAQVEIDELEFGLFFAYSILIVFTTLLSLFRLSSALGKLLNPEYYALMEILNLF